MISWIRNYYVGSGIQNPELIEEKIKKKEYPLEIYLLTFPTNQNNVLDLFSARLLKNPFLEEGCPEVVGMAKGKAAAIDLAGKILLECHRKTGNFRVEEYLKNR